MPGEFAIVERYFRRPSRDPSVLLGIGDDAAVIAVDGDMAVTVDTLVAGVHFPEGIEPRRLGFRTLAVNLSDLAAMGAEPRWCTLALTLPQSDAAWLEGFSSGLFELAEQFDVALVGGNLARGPLSATLTLFGRVDRKRMLTRGGGRPGDDVYVTGTLGDAAAGLALIRQGVRIAPGSNEAALAERFYRPEPRIAAGLALAGFATAAIDVSDGLVADLGHVCGSSGCGAVVDVERLPLSAAMRAVCTAEQALLHAAGGGDDYELCFTAPPANANAIERALAPTGTGATRIGRLEQGRDVVCRFHDQPYAPMRSGYTHF